jgi:hypothetical protein
MEILAQIKRKMLRKQLLGKVTASKAFKRPGEMMLEQLEDNGSNPDEF